MKKRLDFVKVGDKDIYNVHNQKREWIGTIEKCRVGQYLHWCLCPLPDMQFSAGCLDEIRDFIKNPEKYLRGASK